MFQLKIGIIELYRHIFFFVHDFRAQNFGDLYITGSFCTFLNLRFFAKFTKNSTTVFQQLKNFVQYLGLARDERYFDFATRLGDMIDSVKMTAPVSSTVNPRIWFLVTLHASHAKSIIINNMWHLI